MTQEIKKTMMEDLWDRKVPQYLGTYLAMGFGLLQFVEFITNRYGLGDNVVDKYLLVWLAVLPAIIVLIYFEGQLQPISKSGVLKWPKFLVIVNIVVALLLGGVLFNEEDSNENEVKESEVIKITDEDGNTLTTVVPSLNKVKSVASFQFENLTGDDTQEWWGVAFSNLLHLTMNQRPEFYTYSPYALHGYYNKLGLPSFKVPSVGMQREIAQKSRNDYFTRISYRLENKQFVLEGSLYSSKDGKKIVALNAQNSDPYAAIDDINKQINLNIPNALQEVENQVSLPASTLISNNTEALEYITKSRIAYFKNPNGLEDVIVLAKKAVELDPTCSICHFYVGDPLYGLGRRDEAISYIKNSIKYGKSLPERMQFGPKETLYAITNKMDSYLKILELKRRMFPYDFTSYQSLVSLYHANYGIDSAKSLVQLAIDNGNVEKGLLELYDLQLENEEFKEAERTLDRFTKEFPDREQDRLKYADNYEQQGRIDEAREILIEEEALDPLNTSIQIRLAYLDFKDHNIDAAFDRIEDGILQATTNSDSANLYWAKIFFLNKTGRITDAFEALKDFEKTAIKRSPINRIVSTTYSLRAEFYFSLGATNKIDQVIEMINKYTEGFESRNECLMNSEALLNGYQMKMDKQEYAACQEVYSVFGDGYEDYFALQMAYLNEEFDKAVEILKRNNQKLKKMISNKSFLALIYAGSGDTNEAKRIMKKAIDEKPDEPVFYYRMASLLENDDKIRAKENLEIALRYWKEADADYVPLGWAQELDNRLSK